MRAHRRPTTTTYTETTFASGEVRLVVQLSTLDAEAHAARDKILREIARYLAEDRVVAGLLAEDYDKSQAFFAGLVEVINSMASAASWLGSPREIAVGILREGSRLGMQALYLASRREGMEATLG